jgi:pyruvate,water dikinase
LEQHYRVWVTLAGQRETGKHYVIEVVDRFRKRVLQVAGAFVAAGRLDAPSQIFDLTLADVDRALGDSGLDLRALVRERSGFIERVRRSRLAPPVIDSRGRMFFPPRQAAESGALAGVPISPGIARGRVKVLHSVDEKPLLPGEILVARATNPGWTPLFINAKGIILEIGGALQHGAVVAREYGIPCVSGLHGATDLLQDGQLVEVDGSQGNVRVLEGS